MNGKIKPSYDENRQCLGKIFPLDTPFTVTIDTSEVCNFKCKYCFRACTDKTAWGYADNSIMDWEIFEKAVFQIKQFPNPVKMIALSHQGEPLCNPKLPEMVKYIKGQGINSKISIHTNGSLLTEAMAIQLAESNIDKIVVSLQGLDKDKYKEICGYSLEYNTFYENWKLFYSLKRNTQVSIKIVDDALEPGQEELFIEKFSPISDRVFIERVIPLWEKVDFKGNGHEEEFVYNKFGETHKKQQCCPLLFDTIVVIPNGDVYPCTQLLSKERLGNILDDKLVDLWNGDKRKELLKKQLELDADEVCRNCYIKQNSILTKEDMIDDYRNDILKRL